MPEFELTKETLLLFSPLLLLQLGLAAYCGSKIAREGVQNLNKWAWFFICLCGTLVGPILYLLVGRKQEFK